LLNEKIITGTSRMGYELALKFANAGHQVLAISEKTLGF
jgi:NAD(P)-dependent dehydrogenase (short-subunit alcohol dehydrogenase family)